METLLEYGKGITHSPSDFLCGDGELDECVNLEVKNGELTTAEMPVEINLQLSESGERLMCVHTTESGLHSYITLTTNKYSVSTTIYTLHAYKKVNNSFIALDFTKAFTRQPKKIVSLGNILIVSFEESLSYILYKDTDYEYLGDRLPETDISFSLDGSTAYESYTLEGVGYITDNGIHMPDFSTSNNNATETAVLGFVNKFINEDCMQNGYFMYPFFIRWAYRLFDGTHTMQSAPILLLPSTYAAPQAGLCADNNATKRETFPIYVASYLAKIVANIASDQLAELKKWEDIIAGIDFYVSPQIYSYTQESDGMMDYLNGSKDLYDAWPFKKSYILGKTDTAYSQYNGKHSLYDLVSLTVSNFGHYTFTLPMRSESDIYDDICENSLFYKYASLGLSDLKAGDNNLKDYGLEITSNDVIRQQETLDDDYQSHDTMVPQSLIVYNKRLNASNVKRQIFNGFTARAMLQGLEYTKGMTGTNKSTWQAKVKVSGNTVGSEITTACPYCLYLYYPSVDAETITLVNTGGSDTYIKLNLTEHTGLNGAYYFGGFGEAAFATTTSDLSIGSTTVWETQANALWLSEVSNPFQFDLNGMYTVGNGSLIGLAALVRPVSQGQFGEYPLIAFCTDGNYGLRVSDEGYYTNISPMQEDVALSEEQITTLENTILLITKKGLMQADGSTIAQVCQQMEGRVQAVLSDARKGEWAGLIGAAEDGDGFFAYLYGARMAYDYASDRVLLYRSDRTYSYVLHMDTGTVTKLVIGDGESILTHIIDYPDVIVQTDNAIYSLYQKEDVNALTDKRKGFALTRPMKMGMPSTLKVIERVKTLWQRMNGDSTVKYALYGSNDNITWHAVTTRFGKAWKLYKLALYTDMLPGESLSGTQIILSARRDNKPR